VETDGALRTGAEPGRAGPDHGTAAPQLLLGGRVKGGFYGQQPSLARLVNEDLSHHVDYRRLYATVTRGWWNLPDPLFSKRHPPIDCLS
jgi:uncharacterized protein (DUF1501 family)